MSLWPLGSLNSLVLSTTFNRLDRNRNNFPSNLISSSPDFDHRQCNWTRGSCERVVKILLSFCYESCWLCYESYRFWAFWLIRLDCIDNEDYIIHTALFNWICKFTQCASILFDGSLTENPHWFVALIFRDDIDQLSISETILILWVNFRNYL